MRKLVPFLACGDANGWDADATYALPSQGYQWIPPVQPPTAPPYRVALEKIRQQQQQEMESENSDV